MEKIALLLAVAVFGLAISSSSAAEKSASAEKAAPKGPLDFQVQNIEEKPVDLSTYKGKVVMIVNVASKCGLTPQYEGLEDLYEKYKDQGFVILGFPANEFGAQEPGTNPEIAQFCRDKYSVDFPMFSKIVVKGAGIAPLYDFLTSEKTDPKFSGEISWNFEKFLIGRNGEVVARFKPRTTPDAPEVVKAIESEIAKK